MRRTLKHRSWTPVLIAGALAGALALSACGSDSGSSSDPSLDTVADSTLDAGADSGADSSDPATSVEDAPTPTNPDKPDVEIPEEIPTELVVTELTPGEGREAVAGDTVVLDYVGVRSSDGVEFDNSYDQFEPFSVVLGAGSVIQGWETGLVGAQGGQRLQLDIPADLAYGDQARGDIIRENEALTFVVDVRSVIPASDPADEPTEAGVPASEGATEVTTVDLVEGTGPAVEAEQTAVIHLVLFRGDNLVAIDSTWDGQPIPVPMSEGAFPGLLEGLEGMKVGGRRAIVIPPDQGFGAEGNPQMGLPADTDIVMVVDLLGVY
jgi:FKBP-type peptidyl-prolyl cis-trans isomerase